MRITNIATMYGAQTNDHHDSVEGMLSCRYILGGRGISSLALGILDLNNMTWVATSDHKKCYQQIDELH